MTEAEQIMQNAALYWKEEYARFVAMRQKLGKKWSYDSDIIKARAWRDLGFSLKRWMRDILQQFDESLVPQIEPSKFQRSESPEARARAETVNSMRELRFD